jgi:hypothetical protein
MNKESICLHENLHNVYQANLEIKLSTKESTFLALALDWIYFRNKSDANYLVLRGTSFKENH